MTTPLKVFIADDEAPARARLRELLGDLRPGLEVEVVGEARQGLEAVERIPGSGAQVALLDIEMPGASGLEVARHLTRLDAGPAIVFVTAHDRHAIEAFELQALDYLLKPVRATRLAEALRRALDAGAPGINRLTEAAQRLQEAGGAPRSHLSLTERNRILLIPLAEVLYLKAEQKYVTVRTHASEHLIDESLIALEREFSQRFVRVHRNCLVARAAIRGFERTSGGDADAHWEVLLEGLDERLPVSRRQWSLLREETNPGG